MADPLEALQKLTTCPFCMNKFTGVIKLIPDCGRSICGKCYQVLKEDLGESNVYNCKACGGRHTLPENEFPDCTFLLDLLGVPVEKPLSPQAKRLQLFVDSVQEELAKQKAFDAKEFIKQHCDELEAQVADAAESAFKHIKEIETGLYKQIAEYRQRRLNDLTPGSSASSDPEQMQESSIEKTQAELDALSVEINGFGIKWNEYFSRLNVLASDAEIDAALVQADAYLASLKDLDRKLRICAFKNISMLFNVQASFHAERNHLGVLLEIATRNSQELNEIMIQETPSKTIFGKKESNPYTSDELCKVIFLPKGRLASCSTDKSIKIWDTTSGQALFTLSGHTKVISALAPLPNGWLASGSEDRTIKLWDLEARKEVKILSGHYDSIADLKVLNNGHLASYSRDDTIKVWDPCLDEDSLLLTLEGHGNKDFIITMGVLSNDFLVTCSRDKKDNEEGILRVWDSKDGQLVKSLPTGLKRVEAVLGLSNDQVAIGTQDGTIKVIDLEDEQRSRSKEKAHSFEVYHLLQLSHEILASAGLDVYSSAYIYSIKVWKFSDMSLLQHIKTDHSKWINSLRINEDETQLASGSWDNTIKLWPITHF